jgi:RNA polymerase sigma factor (TIGR02999 family)
MSVEDDRQLTRILTDPAAADPAAILPLVYEQLRRLAQQQMTVERPGQTLQATALVHEAWLRLVGDRPVTWKNRAHFFAAAAEAMRRILVERARRKISEKHGGRRQRVDLVDSDVPDDRDAQQVLAVSDALERLAQEDPRKAELVKLRYFAGLTIAEAAEALGVSHATAERDWTYSRLRLYEWLHE